MYCTACGAAIAPGAGLCRSCGRVVPLFHEERSPLASEAAAWASRAEEPAAGADNNPAAAAAETGDSPAAEQLQNASDLYDDHQYVSALRECAQVIASEPKNAEAHNLRGLILEELDRQHEALAAYGQAVRLDPTLSEAAENYRELAAELQKSRPYSPKLGRVSPTANKRLPAGTALEANTNERAIDMLRLQQNLPLAILAGAGAAVAGAVLWALFVAVTGYQLGLVAIAVGFLVGFAVRRAGAGIDTRFGVTGALLALFGCLLGNALAVCILIARETGVPLFDLLVSLDIESVLDLLSGSFRGLDLFFYGLAAYEGYRFSFPKLTAAEIQRLSDALPGPDQEPLRRPGPSNRVVAVIMIGLVAACLSTGFALRQVRGDYFGALVHRNRGLELEERGDYDRADEEYLAAARLYPADARNQMNAGMVYYYQEQYSQAHDALQEAIRLDPELAEAYTGLGWVLFELNAFGDAAANFETALQMDGEPFWAQFGLGLSYYAMGEPAKAVGPLEAAAELGDEQAEVAELQEILAEVYALLEDPADERDTSAAAAAQDPEQSPVSLNMGWTYLDRGKLDEASAVFLEFVRRNPDSAEAHYGLGVAYLRQGKLHSALQPFQKAIRLDPDLVDAHYGLAAVYMGRGEFEQAVAILQTLAELEPDWGVPYALLALNHYQLDDLEGMEQALEQALALEADDALTSYYIALIFAHRRQFTEAEAHLKQAIELAPGDKDNYLILAVIYRNQGDYDRAMASIDEAISHGANPAEAAVARSSVYLAQADYESALVELEEALQLDAPNVDAADAHANLSEVYLRTGRPAEALAEAREAVNLQPYHVAGTENLAFAYQALGQLDSALAAAQRSVKYVPKQDLAHYILGLCYLDKGDTDKAAAELQEFLDLYWDRPLAREYKALAEEYLSQLP